MTAAPSLHDEIEGPRLYITLHSANLGRLAWYPQLSQIPHPYVNVFVKTARVSSAQASRPAQAWTFPPVADTFSPDFGEQFTTVLSCDGIMDDPELFLEFMDGRCRVVLGRASLLLPTIRLGSLPTAPKREVVTFGRAGALSSCELTWWVEHSLSESFKHKGTVGATGVVAVWLQKCESLPKSNPAAHQRPNPFVKMCIGAAGTSFATKTRRDKARGCPVSSGKGGSSKWTSRRIDATQDPLWGDTDKDATKLISASAAPIEISIVVLAFRFDRQEQEQDHDMLGETVLDLKPNSVGSVSSSKLMLRREGQGVQGSVSLFWRWVPTRDFALSKRHRASSDSALTPGKAEVPVVTTPHRTSIMDSLASKSQRRFRLQSVTGVHNKWVKESKERIAAAMRGTRKSAPARDYTHAWDMEDADNVLQASRASQGLKSRRIKMRKKLRRMGTSVPAHRWHTQFGSKLSGKDGEQTEQKQEAKIDTSTKSKEEARRPAPTVEEERTVRTAEAEVETENKLRLVAADHGPPHWSLVDSPPAVLEDEAADGAALARQRRHFVKAKMAFEAKSSKAHLSVHNTPTRESFPSMEAVAREVRDGTDHESEEGKGNTGRRRRRRSFHEMVSELRHDSLRVEELLHLQREVSEADVKVLIAAAERKSLQDDIEAAKLEADIDTVLNAVQDTESRAATDRELVSPALEESQRISLMIASLDSQRREMEAKVRKVAAALEEERARHTAELAEAAAREAAAVAAREALEKKERERAKKEENARAGAREAVVAARDALEKEERERAKVEEIAKAAAREAVAAAAREALEKEARERAKDEEAARATAREAAAAAAREALEEEAARAAAESVAAAESTSRLQSISRHRMSPIYMTHEHVSARIAQQAAVNIIAQSETKESPTSVEEDPKAVEERKQTNKVALMGKDDDDVKEDKENVDDKEKTKGVEKAAAERDRRDTVALTAALICGARLAGNVLRRASARVGGCKSGEVTCFTERVLRKSLKNRQRLEKQKMATRVARQSSKRLAAAFARFRSEDETQTKEATKESTEEIKEKNEALLPLDVSTKTLVTALGRELSAATTLMSDFASSAHLGNDEQNVLRLSVQLQFTKALGTFGRLEERIRGKTTAPRAQVTKMLTPGPKKSVTRPEDDEDDEREDLGSPIQIIDMSAMSESPRSPKKTPPPAPVEESAGEEEEDSEPAVLESPFASLSRGKSVAERLFELQQRLGDAKHEEEEQDDDDHVANAQTELDLAFRDAEKMLKTQRHVIPISSISSPLLDYDDNHEAEFSDLMKLTQRLQEVQQKLKAVT